MAAKQYILKKAGSAVKKAIKAPPTPAVHASDRAKIEEIYRHAEQQRVPDYQPATEPVFAPADPELTKRLVSQTSIADQLPQLEPDALAEIRGGRTLPILENRDVLARLLAQSIEQTPGSNLPFYSTGTVLEGLSDVGNLSPEAATRFMRDWAGQGAATSPRTKTPPNLRNASYLLHREAQGIPMSKDVWEAEKPFWQQEYGLSNRPGFPLIGKMHPALSHEFATGTANPLENPKPFTFRENWSGNMADVTADTHNIRAILDAFDEMFPGTLQREWFQDEASHARYLAGGGFPKEGSLESVGIEDTLGSMSRDNVKSQLEYPAMQGPTVGAAKLLGISPAEAQERLWFAKGPRTGLASPPMTIPDLLNAQIETTARVLGIPPKEVMRLWARRRIPLAEADVSDVPGSAATA